MTTQIDTIQAQTAHAQLKNLIWVGPLAMLAAAAVNLGLYAAAGRLFPEVTAWPGAGAGQIVGATVVYLLVGAAVCAAVGRLSARPARPFLAVATVGLLLSLGLPIMAGLGYDASGAPAAGLPTVVALSLMHVASYAISVPLFTRLALD